MEREAEAKAKVDASVWGAKFVQFLAAPAVLPRSIWKKRLNSTGFFQIDRDKTAGVARKWTNFSPKYEDAMPFAFASLSILLL